MKQGDGTLVLPNVTETYTGNTDVWAGTLQFDGTMEKSPVWLNRFARLSSNGGKFLAGIKADYGSEILPGGNNQVGTINASSIELGFGARVIFDVNGNETDRLVADNISIEKKDWTNGPEYSAPVFVFTSQPIAGTYILAEASGLTGNLSDVTIEGLTGVKYDLAYADGKITLNVYNGRGSEDVVWTGATDGTWDLMNSENFSSSDKKFVTGDEVTFDDSAVNTAITVAEDVTPGNIIFKNDSKTYSITGEGAISGEGTLSVEGNGEVKINNINKYNGGTIISNGILTPASLANNDGSQYGSLGDVSNGITLKNNGTLKTATSMTASHPIIIDENGGTINTTGTLILNGSIKKANTGKSRNLYKAGTGTLQLNCAADFDSLYINSGTVYDFQDAHFTGKTIVLNGSKVTLQANNSIYSSNTDNVNIVVPNGKTGIWYPDGRCDYTGKLTGEGKIDIYATWVRCAFKGNWSEFEGTINAKRGTKNAYEPVFDFCNTYGMPKATLNVDSRFTKDTPFNTNGKSFAIGALTGSGYISNGGNFGSGTNTLTVGGNNTNFTFSGTINGSHMVKNGTGVWTIASETVLANAKSLKIIDGAVKLNKAAATTSMTAPTITYVQDNGELRGMGYCYGINLLNGGTLRPGSNAATSQTKNAGIISIEKNLNAETGSHIYVNKTKTDSISVNSITGAESQAWAFIKVGGNATVNATIHVTYGTTWTPAEGDYVRVFDCEGTISGTPSFDLQELPEGLGWDTTKLLSEGVIYVGSSTGIMNIDANTTFTAEVYTLTGVKVATGVITTRATLQKDLKAIGLSNGTYIVRSGKNSFKISF